VGRCSDEIAHVGAKLGGANGLWRGGAGTAGVATMLAEADLVFFVLLPARNM